MTKRKKQKKRQTTVYKAPHRKLKLKQFLLH